MAFIFHGNPPARDTMTSNHTLINGLRVPNRISGHRRMLSEYQIHSPTTQNSHIFENHTLVNDLRVPNRTSGHHQMFGKHEIHSPTAKDLPVIKNHTIVNGLCVPNKIAHHCKTAEAGIFSPTTCNKRSIESASYPAFVKRLRTPEHISPHLASADQAGDLSYSPTKKLMKGSLKKGPIHSSSLWVPTRTSSSQPHTHTHTSTTANANRCKSTDKAKKYKEALSTSETTTITSTATESVRISTKQEDDDTDKLTEHRSSSIGNLTTAMQTLMLSVPECKERQKYKVEDSENFFPKTI
ncbi:hypothetical protein C8035_v002074 [Colletotrichum spinosum]|uniref:Uncharacterized protein n=1 Tax=Colletotrichum spinosum TaxID=1347390 RepID=A0A4R8PXI8_9PEZI|nr:hypothetical protein C8035_v002074 [Colletotrichum spinosum]